MNTPKTLEEYQALKKKGTFIRYIWKWSANKSTPDNFLIATSIRIFGMYVGWKVVVVKRGYENVFFTNNT